MQKVCEEDYVPLICKSSGVKKFTDYSESELEKELAAQETRSNDAYWKFTRGSAKQCAGYVKALCEADKAIARIKTELRRRHSEIYAQS